MFSLQLQPQPDGFALRFRFVRPTPPTPRAALAACAYVSVGLAVLAVAAVPESRAFAATPPEPGSVETATVLEPTRPPTVIRADPPRVVTHIVGPDETIFTLADSYHVTPQTIAYNNGLTDTSALRSGEVLVIPTIDAAVYTVRSDDTVAEVAERFGVVAAAVVEANRLLYEPDNFSPGSAIIVPVPDGRFPGFRLRIAPAVRPAPFARSLTRARLLLPVAGGIITQGFSSYHTAVDVAGPYGAPVRAAEAGTVAAVGWVSTGGLRVCVRHDWGLQTCYYHLSSTRVSEGERVGRGEVVGTVGTTGVTTGPHVHWEASIEGAFVDPLSY